MVTKKITIIVPHLIAYVMVYVVLAFVIADILPDATPWWALLVVNYLLLVCIDTVIPWVETEVKP